MKELNERQKKLACQAVKNLRKLQDEGVVTLIIDSGGGNGGLHFWIPNEEDDENAEKVIHTNEFRGRLYEFTLNCLQTA